MTKTKLLTFRYKSSTLKTKDVRKAIKEVYGDDLYSDEDEDDDKQIVEKASKKTKVSKSLKKG